MFTASNIHYDLADRCSGIACGGRPHLKALFVAGERVVEDDAIPGVDLRELAAQARAATRRLLDA